MYVSVYKQGDQASNDTLNYYPIFLRCDFRAANFTNASLGNAYFMLSDMRYANLKGAEKPKSAIGLRTSDYSNAWWYDGSRCASISVGLCIPVPDAFNTGLTYEEYLKVCVPFYVFLSCSISGFSALFH